MKKRIMKILIVDDIFSNRLLLREILRFLDHEIIEVENGKDAIDVILTDQIDLVLMDIEMPVMNGIETTRYIREELPNPKNATKVIALTAHNPSQFFNDFRDAGFDQLLSKPYSIKKLAELLEPQVT